MAQQGNDLFTKTQIQERVVEIADSISKDYKDEEILVVCVLKGSFIFCADLIREIKSPLMVDFLGISSYEGTESSGSIVITKEITSDITNKHILIVEDIIDTGLSMNFIVDKLKRNNPKSIKICTLINKPDNHKVNVDYFGFNIYNEFIIGYGLDYNEKYRNLSSILELKE